MTRLKRWMMAVGGFYVLVGLFNTPYVVRARLLAQYPEFDAPVDSVAARALIDTWFMFGLEILVIGVALLVFSRQPGRNVALAWTVIALEVVRGIVDDLYLIARGADPVIYSGWIAIHLVIILSGLWAIRSARIDSRSEGASSASVGDPAR